MTIEPISLIIGILSGAIGTFLLSKLSEFIKVILVAKYYKENPPKKGGVSAEELEKVKKSFGVNQPGDKEQRG